ncbi:MAG: serine hydrolase [Pseudomonadota bacterium]
MKNVSPYASLSRGSLNLALAICLYLLVVATAPAANGPLTAALHAAVAETYKATEPGAAIIVVKDGEVVLREGAGMANLEMGIAVEPQMVFRIGSVTKQFTAVSILLLSEQGKLSLADDITRFLPDYPTHGVKITIENLLTHTSGIKSYTDLPEFWKQQRKDLTLPELIGLFKDQPTDFSPGERWHYSNSGYVLLGAIIEKASGQSYADFIDQNLFKKVGMAHSRFDRTAEVIAGRVSGYKKTDHGFLNADYISMSLPHAAGSLLSTVDDLALWDAALYTDKLVTQASLQRAWSSFHLNDGTPTNYGYGWIISSIEGLSVLSHSGGINGFSSMTVRIADSHVYAAVLTNRDSGDAKLARKLAVLASGKIWHDPIAITLPVAKLEKLVGVYRLNAADIITVSVSNGALTADLPRYGKLSLSPVSELEFLVSDDPIARIVFERQTRGAITGLSIRSGIGPNQRAERVDRVTAPAPR